MRGRNLRVALVHDFLTVYGGAERVLEAILELYPQADVFTTVYDLNNFPKNSPLRSGGESRSTVGERGWRGRLFGLNARNIFGGVARIFTFLYPLVFERYSFYDYDLVISSSSNFAKGVLVPPNTLHIAYIHTPPRFLYGYQTEGNWRERRITRPFLRPIDFVLRVWDYQAAWRPDYLLTNSQNTAKRIKKFYRRTAKVIYPPVSFVGRVGESGGGVSPSQGTPINTIGFNGRDKQGSGEVSRRTAKDYYLVVSRLSRYKNIDLVIEAFSSLPKERLKVVGVGPELLHLREKIKKLGLAQRVELLGFVDDKRLTGLYQGARALICVTEDEDFGITPVEAMACGTPVIALRSGGYRETVIDGQTGVFFDEPKVAALVKVLRNFDPHSFNSRQIKKHALRFSRKRFLRELQEFVDAKVSQWGERR